MKFLVHILSGDVRQVCLGFPEELCVFDVLIHLGHFPSKLLGNCPSYVLQMEICFHIVIECMYKGYSKKSCGQTHSRAMCLDLLRIILL
jgi:hypothetical protein